MSDSLIPDPWRGVAEPPGFCHPFRGEPCGTCLWCTAGEVRTTSSTGGEKGVKPARFDLIPVGPLATVAKLYGKGAEKYDDHNWRRGYEWSKSYAALMRHVTQFWGGEDVDPDTELPHLAAVVFHAMALMQFMEEHNAFDDRPIAKAASSDVV
jgi:hypothetical protein